MRRILGYCVLLMCISAYSQEIAPTPDTTRQLRPRRIRVSAGVLGGILVHGEKPIYPEESLQNGVKGDVILQVQIDETGKVIRGLAVEGDPILVAASEEALRGFQFRPYLIQGNPIEVESQIGFTFASKGKGGKAHSRADYTFDVPDRPEFRTGSVTQDGILILSPRKISGPDPVLPSDVAGKSGSVYLTVTIGTSGKVENIKIVGGDVRFTDAVIAALRQDVFEPQLIDGKPSVAVVQASFHFGSY